MLPEGRVYAEPFAGMLGVLLQREPSRIELVNDIDGRVANWWRVVRDMNDELVERLQWTPRSEEEFYNIRDGTWDDKDELWKAWAFTIIIWQSYASKSYDMTRFSRNYATPPRATQNVIDKIEQLRDRLINVQIFNTEAATIINKLNREEDAVIYCDPPYYTARQDTYKHVSFDIEGFKETVADTSCRILISGYPGEYDDLGWETCDMPCITPTGYAPRTERVWANFPLERHIQTSLLE